MFSGSKTLLVSQASQTMMSTHWSVMWERKRRKRPREHWKKTRPFWGMTKKWRNSNRNFTQMMSVCLILLTMNKTNIGLFAILEGLQHNTYYIHNNIQCKYNILNFLTVHYLSNVCTHLFILHYYYFPHCSIIVKLSKLWHNTNRMMGVLYWPNVYSHIIWTFVACFSWICAPSNPWKNT